MKAIIGGRLYNTETAEVICTVSRRIDRGLHFETHEIDLYRTKKGSWFEHDRDAGTIKPIKEEAAQGIIQRLDPDRFMELFGPVPEA